MRVAFAVLSRANWSSVAPVATLLRREGHGVVLLRGGSALVDRYGAGGLPELGPGEYEIRALVEDGPTETACLAAAQTGAILRRERPDWLYVVGDRHEMLGAAMAGAYEGVPIAHQMGGERSGLIDDRVRDAISALATLHLAATAQASERLRSFVAGTVVQTGCPRIDGVREAVAGEWPLPAEYLLVYVHPADAGVARATMSAAVATGLPVRLCWPNADPGSAAVVRELREHGPDVAAYRALSPARYALMMHSCSVLVGNSSSGLREGAWLGVPAVNVGTRQQLRERAANVLDVGLDAGAILEAIDAQRAHGRYQRSDLYGDGHAAPRIVAALGGA